MPKKEKPKKKKKVYFNLDVISGVPKDRKRKRIFRREALYITRWGNYENKNFINWQRETF